MKEEMMKLAVGVAFLISAVAASAQQAVKTVDAPYVPPSSAVAIPVVAAKGVDDVIGANPFMSLVPGKTVAEQLRQMGATSGWQLLWEAADFSIEQKVQVSSDFVSAVTTIVNSANQTGTKLKATFYRGNNIVRVTEF